jgi:hypothetical protein
MFYVTAFGDASSGTTPEWVNRLNFFILCCIYAVTLGGRVLF